ncbi:MAG: hypothetical protein AB7D06_08975 [Pedobacter sp.]
MPSLVDMTPQRVDLVTLRQHLGPPRSDLSPAAVVRPFFNGMNLGGYTYTGGPVAVADADGVLRSGYLDVPSIEGGRYATTVAEGAALGSELVTALDFNNGWAVAAATITSSTSFSTEGVGGLFKAFVVSGKKYSVSLSGTCSATFKLVNGGSGSDPTILTGFGSATFTASGANPTLIYLRLDGAGIMSDVSLSVREVIPQWLDTDTEGADLYASTLVRGQKLYTDADHTEFPRIDLWGASTNKCTCRKANPTDTSNIGTGGDAAAVLSVVDDSDALAAAGLDKICTSGKVYKLDNSAGISSAWVLLGAVTTAPHSGSAYIRSTGGNITIYVTSTPHASPTYIRRTVTAAGTATQMTISAVAGAVVYFILPQLEESPYCTPPIYKATDGTDPLTSLTRPNTKLVGQSAGVIRGNNLALMGQVIPGASGTAGYFVSFDAATTTGVFSTGTQVKLYKDGISATVAIPISKNTPMQYQAYLSSTYGMGIRVRYDLGLAWSAWMAWATNADTQDAPIASTFEIGSRADGNRFNGNYQMFLPYFTADPKTYLENLEIAA